MSTIRVNTILDAAGGNAAQINGITPALATLAEAEAGTDNAKLMTPLRAAQAVTTSRVLEATAGLSAGDVGTYAFCAQGTANFTFGGTYAGSGLFPASTALNPTASSTALTGTWRSLGFNNSGAARYSVYVRIA